MQISEKNPLADRINEIAKARDLNLKELAAELDIPYSSLHSYASGRSEPRAALFLALYEKIGINLDWFVGDDGEMYRANRTDQQRQEVVNYGKGANVVTTGVNNGSIVSEVGNDAGGRAGRLCGFVEWFMMNQTLDAQAYLEEHLRRTVPEFEAWLKGSGR